MDDGYSFEGALVAYIALVIMALVPIYIGSWASLDSSLLDDEEQISTSEALLFPVFGSISLFSLYLLLNYLDPSLVNLVLTGLFITVSSSSLFLMILRISLKCFDFNTDTYHFKLTEGANDILDFKFAYVHLGSIFLTMIFSVLYVYTKNWLLSNIYALSYACLAIELIKLDSYKTGSILLMGLFAYDVFWVFGSAAVSGGSSVMEVVATGLDLPIKVLFPRNVFLYNPYELLFIQDKFALLGLGDIVVPGIFISLCLKFDMQQKLNKYPYFSVCMIAYFVGLITTIVVMHPALLYLSPACILSTSICGILRHEFQLLINFNCDVEKPSTLNEQTPIKKVEGNVSDLRELIAKPTTPSRKSKPLQVSPMTMKLRERKK
ncbi:hypothetical protein HDV02_006207 [Globomyces sp. JEL0801]|nr:hypothetical protein HDV02_006207 [Globomyces sp. JEL0801]